VGHGARTEPYGKLHRAQKAFGGLFVCTATTLRGGARAQTRVESENRRAFSRIEAAQSTSAAVFRGQPKSLTAARDYDTSETPADKIAVRETSLRRAVCYETRQADANAPQAAPFRQIFCGPTLTQLFDEGTKARPLTSI
jgi:hypothetical protein